VRDLIIKAALDAGRLLMEKYESGVRVEFKGKYDLVTEADRDSEALIVDMIRKDYPDHDVLAEEGKYGERDSQFRWIIDPLDGTTNYAHSFPWFAVSIAMEKDGVLELGVVYNPNNNEMFVAERGRGAFLGEQRLKVSTVKTLERSLLATGFAYDHKHARANNYEYFNCFQRAAQACRRPGVASLDLASVAAGRFDGFWEMKLKPWDLAAGVLLIEEAGGRVSDFDGEPMALEDPECLASNGLIHDEMKAILQNGCRPHDEQPI
jgi:myo-inositol-1(or 4)-monophosphatase